MRERSFRSDINLLRAISIAAVTLYHFGFNFASGGFIGVDIFFVISGFLMTKIILDRQPDLGSLGSFYRDRVARICPALFAMILLVAAAGSILMDPLQLMLLQREAVFAAPFLSNFLYFRTISYFNPIADNNWLLHTWSLAVEWQFYILYPIYLFGVWKILGRRWVPIAIILLFAASLALTLSGLAPGANFKFYLLPCRAWEMTAGGLAYLAAAGKPPLLQTRPLARALIATLGLAVICATAVFTPEVDDWPSWLTIVPVAACALLLVVNFDATALPVYKPLGYIGLWSYSIYLWHWPVLRYLNYLEPDPAIWQTLLGVAASVLLGALSFTYVERPIGRRLKALKLAPLSILATTAACLLAAFLVAQREVVFSSPSQDVWRSYIAAHNDKIDSDDCLYTRHNAEPCVIHGKIGVQHRTLVIGDSHAQMWLPRLEQARSLGLGDVYLTAYHGCPVLPDLDVGPRPCAAFNRHAFNLAESGKFDRVIYISLWNYIAPDVALCVESVTGCRPVTRQQLAHSMEEFERQLSVLKSKGIDVTLTLPPMNSAQDIPAALARERHFGGDLALIETVSRAEQERKRSVPAAYLKGVAAKYHIRLLDPLDMFCNQTECSYVDALGHPVFRDSNHVRTEFLRTNRFLDPALGVSDRP